MSPSRSQACFSPFSYQSQSSLGPLSASATGLPGECRGELARGKGPAHCCYWMTKAARTPGPERPTQRRHAGRSTPSVGFSPRGLEGPVSAWVSVTAASFSLSPSRQGVGSRLDGLRNRGPGCTWDSLRNSVGEKILSLRSCSLGALGALGSACCSVLSELSEEQAFHVSYLDIGTAGREAGDGGD